MSAYAPSIVYIDCFVSKGWDQSDIFPMHNLCVLCSGLLTVGTTKRWEFAMALQSILHFFELWWHVDWCTLCQQLIQTSPICEERQRQYAQISFTHCVQSENVPTWNYPCRVQPLEVIWNPKLPGASVPIEVPSLFWSWCIQYRVLLETLSYYDILVSFLLRFEGALFCPLVVFAMFRLCIWLVNVNVCVVCIFLLSALSPSTCCPSTTSSAKQACFIDSSLHAAQHMLQEIRRGISDSDLLHCWQDRLQIAPWIFKIDMHNVLSSKHSLVEVVEQWNWYHFFAFTATTWNALHS